MKRIIMLFAATLIMASASAQTKAYVSLGVGAGISTARTYDLYSDGDKIYPVGLGSGFGPVLRAGLFVTDFMAVELGVNYHFGFTKKIEPDVSSGVKSSGASALLKYSGSMLQLIPAVVIQPNFDLGNVAPYARIGLIVGVLPSIKTKFEVNDGTDVTAGTLKYTGNVSIGGTAALGCDFSLSEMLAIYAEIYYDAMSYVPTKGKMTAFTLNGEDKLSDMTTSEKEVKFVKDLTGFTPSDDEPDQELRTSYPFNNVGINVGVKIKL
jgi:hypothetical protein